MGKSNLASKKAQTAQKAKKKVFATAGIVAVLILGFIFIKFGSNGEVAGDLIIKKSEITENVKFYPYKAGRTNMEVLVVKAGDGTIRTAFNTCQVCFASGRGYYKQQGDELVCQNCGNRFEIDQVEKIKGGCNPVPITTENKIEDEENIVISQAFLEESKDLFGNWRKQ